MEFLQVILIHHPIAELREGCSRAAPLVRMTITGAVSASLEIYHDAKACSFQQTRWTREEGGGTTGCMRMVKATI